MSLLGQPKAKSEILIYFVLFSCTSLLDVTTVYFACVGVPESDLIDFTVFIWEQVEV